MSQSIQIGVIADDFTGAADSGVQFTRYGLETLLGVSALPGSQVVVLNTASRERTPEEARARCAQAAAQLHDRLIFKKIDSTLRGHIGAELEGLLSVSKARKVVVCPAAPQQGRVVIDGIVYVNATPLHESPFRNDPVSPARTSVIGERLGIAATHLPLAAVRQPVEELAASIRAAHAAVVTVDAVNEADLFHISQAVIQSNAIPCGALGLADAWAQAFTGKPPAPARFTLPSEDGPVLIIAGSANPSTHSQIAALGQHTDCLIRKLHVPLEKDEEVAPFSLMQSAWSSSRAIAFSPAIQETTRDAAWLSFAESVSRLAVKLIRQHRPACLVIVGGETANHLCSLLGVDAVRLEGEAAPGVPFGQLIGGIADGLTVVTKAGGFGQADCLEKIVYGNS